ncbi:MAG: GGDEF domain-containing protein [Peptostreptococcaceae bacterium]
MNKISKNIDICMVAFFMEIFVLISVLFISYGQDNSINTYIILSLSFVMITITYIGGMIPGLIGASVSVFIYSIYIFYNNIALGREINFVSYIWMVLIAIITITIGKLNENIVALQKANKKLQEEYHELVTIDSTTGLNNIKHFYDYLNKDIKRARRHKHDLTLMMINLPYYAEIKQILGEKKYNQFAKDLGNIIKSCVRGEDDIYSLDNDTIAIVMANTNEQGAQIVKGRIKDKIAKLNLELNENKYNINIDTKIAALAYQDSISDAIEYKQKCEAELEYDV